jgi:putative copper resistance protein D
MEIASAVLTVVHLLAAVAWLGGMVFHIFVLDPVFRHNEVSFQSAYLLALMEARFRKLVGFSIALLVASGAGKAYLLLGAWESLTGTAAGRYVLAKIALVVAMLVIFAVCPKTKSCSSIPGVCEVASDRLPSGNADGTIRERSKVVLPKVALALGVCALVAAVFLRG